VLFFLYAKNSCLHVTSDLYMCVQKETYLNIRKSPMYMSEKTYANTHANFIAKRIEWFCRKYFVRGEYSIYIYVRDLYIYKRPTYM